MKKKLWKRINTMLSLAIIIALTVIMPVSATANIESAKPACTADRQQDEQPNTHIFFEEMTLLSNDDFN